MAVVDVDYEVYKCPHCKGYLHLRKQYPHDGYGCSTSLEHSMSKDPESGVGEELEECRL